MIDKQMKLENDNLRKLKSQFTVINIDYDGDEYNDITNKYNK